jgi:glucose-1-phosphate adenylyltransferase
LYDSLWPIHTHQSQSPPAKFVFDDPDRCGQAISSMVSGGCIISGGTVRSSLLFSNCRVAPYSLVHDSVILPDVKIGEHCRIHRTIIDRGAVVADGMQIGFDAEADRARGFRVTESGLRLVTAEMLGQQLHMTR